MKFLLLIGVLLACVGMALGQSSQANVSGLISDAQGAVIVGAEVIIRNVATGAASASTTNDSGLYAVRALSIGRYTLAAPVATLRTMTSAPTMTAP